MAETEQRILKVTSGMLEEEIAVPGIVGLVEGLVPRGVGFPIYQRLPERIDDEGFPIRQHPIIGFSGKDTLPMISDPDELVRGVFAISIEERMLVYDIKGTPVHELRDSYRWSFPPWHYYADKGFQGIVREFEESGYSIRESLDTFLFGHAIFSGGSFVLGEELTTGNLFTPES